MDNETSHKDTSSCDTNITGTCFNVNYFIFSPRFFNKASELGYAPRKS